MARRSTASTSRRPKKSAEVEYNQTVGERLRQVRTSRGLSLGAIEVATGGEVRATALGTYERGEHSVSAVRLAILARVYEVSVEELLPPDLVDGTGAVPSAGEGAAPERVRIDLESLTRARGPEAQLIRLLVASTQDRRAQRAGRSVSVRHDDLVTVAAMANCSIEELVIRLADVGVLRRPPGRPPTQL